MRIWISAEFAWKSNLDETKEINKIICKIYELVGNFKSYRSVLIEIADPFFLRFVNLRMLHEHLPVENVSTAVKISRSRFSALFDVKLFDVWLPFGGGWNIVFALIPLFSGTFSLDELLQQG